MNRIALAIIAFVIWTCLAFWGGWEWRDRAADLAESLRTSADTAAALQAEQQARGIEQQQAVAAQGAGDAATTREEKIDVDYQERLAAAVAGRDSELGRLRHEWAGCETARLSDGAAAAAEAAEQDRLRAASAARIVRAVELAQSERDEAIDRYQALSGAEVQ